MAASITYSNILKYGLQAQYDALATKDASVLYFCTDTKKIYKGTIDFTDAVVFAAEKPAKPIVGKVYILADTGTAEVYNGSAWTVVSYPVVTTLSDASDDVHVPTAKTVYDFVKDEIEAALGGEDVITKVEVSEVEGKVKVTNGQGTATDIAIHGVVTTPTYDAATRKFVFPVVDGDDVEVELGKDIFIDPAANNRYENGKIYLYLNDGDGAEKEDTEIVIPVTALVTDYFGDDTDSIQVDIDSATHKVTATAILRASTVDFTNELKLSTAEGDKGLYVDLSGVRAAISANATGVSTAASYNAANSAAASAAQSDANKANSFAQANSEAISALAVSADNYADANSAAISSLAAAQGSDIEAVSEVADSAMSLATANSAAISGHAVSTDSAIKVVADSAASAIKATADSADSYADANSAAASTAKFTADSFGAANSAAASTAQASADQNTDNLAALAIAVGWGTF